MTALFLIGVLVVGLQGVQHHVPPPMEAEDCKTAPPLDELPNARFERKGGRTTRANVRHHGSTLTVDNVEQGRDLGQYDRLELENPGRVETTKRAVRARARSFLYNHWRDRKRAYLIVTFSSVDATGSSHVFVEPDDAGRWRVYWRIVRDMGDVDDLPTYYSVEWAVPAGWNQPGTPLPPGQEPDPAKHDLEFRDKCGDWENSL